MENASKALLIAAGIMVGVIVLSMIVYAHGKISNYYEAKELAVEGEQLAHFNKKYIGYNRNDVRGTDLLSLINKILDYNDDVNNGEMEISIIIPPNNDKSKLFYYNYDKYYNYSASINLIYETFTDENINTRLIQPATKIENDYHGKELITKLASKMSTVMGENTKQTLADFLKELKVSRDENQVKKDCLKYYQYIQFKRAHFNCTNLTYENGRIKSFEFKFNGTFE